jgi:hypothetical protein
MTAWISLIATALGAVIVIAGNFASDLMRSRREDRKHLTDDKHRQAIEFTLAANNAQGRLRRVPGQGLTGDGLSLAALDAVGNSGVYDARERALLSSPPEMVMAIEVAFREVLAVRDAVAAGSKPDSPGYRKVSDRFERAIWFLRQTAREQLGAATLDLEKITELEVRDDGGA